MGLFTKKPQVFACGFFIEFDFHFGKPLIYKPSFQHGVALAEDLFLED